MPESREPNFFILGAPKCGTTSLAYWLARHPQVFMPAIKELDYFNTDIRKAFTETWPQYQVHYAPALPSHRAVGEASTGYLRSAVAVPAIEARYPACRYIVCLRDPVDMAPAWHRQMRFECWEDVADFPTAWALQAERREGRALPDGCPEPANLQYGEVCALGSQVERLLAHVSAARVRFVLLEDLRDRPREVYRGVQEFLGIEDDGRRHFPALNVASDVPRPVARAIRATADFKRRHGIRFGFGILTGLNRIMGKPPRESLPAATRAMLRAFSGPRWKNCNAASAAICRTGSDRQGIPVSVVTSRTQPEGPGHGDVFDVILIAQPEESG